MKLHFIFSISALTAGTLASNVQLNAHIINELLARDYQTMDRTRLSVLSVLRTAIPSGTTAALPTGTVEPEWYQKLPNDVKSLLPLLYPAAVTTTSSSPSSSTPNTPGLSSISASTTSTSTTTKKVTVTKTLQRPSSGTGLVGLSSANNTVVMPSNGTTLMPTVVMTFRPTIASGTTRPSASSTSVFLSGAGAGMGMVGKLAWVGLGAGYLLLA
ncbi:hypothetical protein GQ44DRAFT_6061 [Phaeosphaeriaceae sp. PMI808]|nr:hypothetical protein GQ44DRAFT_6061 [Phaeosphaeriaceae sp. PMI808]